MKFVKRRAARAPENDPFMIDLQWVEATVRVVEWCALISVIQYAADVTGNPWLKTLALSLTLQISWLAGTWVSSRFEFDLIQRGPYWVRILVNAIPVLLICYGLYKASYALSQSVIGALVAAAK